MEEIYITKTIVKLSPKAQLAWDKFKFDVAKDLKIPLRFGYNGHLTQKQAGMLGGEITRRCVIEGKTNIIKRYMEEISRNP